MIFIFLVTDYEQEILGIIYDKHIKRMLFKAAELLGKDRSEDAVHDLIVKLIENYDGNLDLLLNKPARFFVVSARNHSLNLLEKEKFAISIDDIDVGIGIALADHSSNPEEVVFDEASEDALVTLIQKLKPIPRMMLEMKYIQELSNGEIAEILDLSQSAVSSRIDRAKKMLKDMLLKEAYPNG